MVAPVMPGDVLAGKYRVERLLGEGGMGVVVAARHLQLDQVVALKFLLPEAIVNPEALGRFEREARHASRLRSEHIARILDVGTLASGAPYIVMEFLHGTDLSGVLAQQHALPIPVAVDFLLQACDAIAEAHAHGIIHRDLKPQNLFVTQRHDGTPLVKVLDFGISKSTAAESDFSATRTHAVMGSPGYMSPEQMRSTKRVDVRTDVWSLGIILYQLVLGRVPWEDETFAGLCLKVAMDPLPPFPNPSLPPEFEAVVRRCLEKDPDRRFPNVYALAVALAPFAPSHAQPLVESIGRVLRSQTDDRAAIPTIVGPGPGTLPETAGQRMTRTAAGSRSRRIAGLVATLVMLIGIVAIAIAIGTRHQGEPASRTASRRLPDHTAAQPATEMPMSPPGPERQVPPIASTPVVAPPVAPPPQPPISEPAPPKAHWFGPETPPTAKVELPPVPSSTTRPDKGSHRRPSSPAPAKPAPSKPATPDPLGSPD